MNAKVAVKTRIDLNQLRIFALVVERGSMTGAARTLGSPVSRVSRTVARLEDELGAALIVRTTRSFQITEAGRPPELQDCATDSEAPTRFPVAEAYVRDLAALIMRANPETFHGAYAPGRICIVVRTKLATS